MEDKVAKIFNYFDDIKNENVFSLCVSQLIELYEFCPQSLRIILYSLKKLFFSNSKDSRLRLKQRQLAASIIGKLAAIYNKNLVSFANENTPIEMEQFQIQEYSDEEPNTTESFDWPNIDFIQQVNKRAPLFASDKGNKQPQADMKELEKKFFQRMQEMQTANKTNVNMLLGNFHADYESDEETEVNTTKSHLSTKMEKLQKKNEEKLKQAKKIIVFNPFSYIYEICMQKLLNGFWEMRHLAVLLLKALLPYLSFVGFKCIIDLSTTQSDQVFDLITDMCRHQLTTFTKDAQSKTNEIICKCIYVLALDKFGDYQFDKINNMIRDVAVVILQSLFRQLDKLNQMTLLSIIKTLLEHKSLEHPIFSWQLRYSFISLLSAIMEHQEQQQYIYGQFGGTFLDLVRLGVNQDDVILAVCDCYNQLWRKRFFSREYAEQVNKKAWDIVEAIDDITYGTISILKLLENLIDDLDSDELLCLARVKKFFTNKILEVRLAFYKLFGKIYKKLNKKKIGFVPDIVLINIEQFLQAIMVEEDHTLLCELENLTTELAPWMFQPGAVHIFLDFTQKLISLMTARAISVQKFSHRFDGYDCLLREQKLQNINSFIFLRIFKFAGVFSHFFKFRLDKFNEIIQLLIVPGESENRIWLLAASIAYYVMKEHKLTPNPTIMKLFDSLLKLEISGMCIDESTSFGKIVYFHLKDYPQKSAAMEQYILTKKVELLPVIYGECMELYKNNCSWPKLQTVLSTLESIIIHMQQLLRYIKILASFCYCSTTQEQPKYLNTIIKAIHQNVKEEKYAFISETTAAAALLLSRILYASNKSVYTKFNNNMLEKTATKYTREDFIVPIKKNDRRINSLHMEALNIYMKDIVKIDSGWVNLFGHAFTANILTAAESSLVLLAGTAHTLMSISDEKFFINLLSLLKQKLNKNDPLVVQILKKLLIHCVQPYSNFSNIYLEWLYQCIKESYLICLEVLESALNSNISRMSPICCIFILRIIKSLSKDVMRETAIQCLSNVLMGAFVSTVSLPFSARLTKKANKGNMFVRDFKNIKNFQYEIAAHCNSQLRSYQLEGIRWMGFLVKYMLNGALCDDMGLGKTLQTHMVIENQYVKSLQKDKMYSQLSLIVAPTTLVEHWIFEYSKYFPKGVLKCKAVYDRKSQLGSDLLNKRQPGCNVVVTSYSCIQKNVELFQNIDFKFLILDQGHLIKNTRTKKFQCIRKLKSKHRFILTGTPIQNKLLELWGIFDFLMPGYLQSEEIFKQKYEKLFNVNLMTFKEDDLLFTDQQKSVLESLHLKVMPFILRRLKSEVLKELPEKIIQDYYCHMTPVQQNMYKEFNHDAKKHELHHETFDHENSHAISLLTKMRKILNHPNLLEADHGYEASGKFLALRQLLEDLGFIDGQKSLTAKIIIFSRFNATLDLIEELLLKRLFPQITYLKLTGNIKNNKRFDVAQEFNDDANIKVLLVTTMIGGYGLNLTSANIVIMFDHDYNPTVDMQAIDRAHRLGQKNAINVYRLITKDTLEQRIMGIQRFKTNLANAIVNIDNASIKNVSESKLPDLLEKVADLQNKQPKATQKISKSFYSNLLKEMEDAIQYEDYGKQY